ncbi:hypothetical protein HYH03_017107 [Edaphochlamys debaryana]|uniref:C-type lectin domain-containing protein n=1 Tax=Edaphochlamys debaryana TaxID=47281 RepID=A0A835XJR3_9CHLO|nr:hypothetical protein HYH03_017107 [Edaphochlamys debaryana]|eukprot:KAG2484088.1 hypothetical protein HYH03_017107 [Edaphochlamys debaryana]
MAVDPFATLTTPEGSTYSYYRTEEPITADEAGAACDALGTKLASFSSADQVKATLWSSTVVNAVDESGDTGLIWTGLRIRWPHAGNRRLLRSSGTDAVDLSDELVQIMSEMEASPEHIPTHTADGRAIPSEIRAHMFLLRQRRALSEASAAGSTSGISATMRALLQDGADPTPDFRGAEMSWADGTSTEFILDNPANMGFLACNRKKVDECCGAVFDIGPDPYPGNGFPTIFFYPCGVQKVQGAMPPAGYMCIDDPVAELRSPSPSPSGENSSAMCKPGWAPARKGKKACRACRPGTYSTDGLKCLNCPAGTKAKKAASKCT